MRRSAADPAAAEAVLRVAVLLEAGALPERVFGYLAATDDAEDSAVHRINDRIAAGERAPDAMASEGDNWRWIAAAWRIAAAVGSPLSPALRSMAQVAVDAQSAADDVRIAMAEPAATVRLMLLMPLISVAMGIALGFDSLRILFTNPIGIACLVVGGGLIALAKWWTTRIITRATSATAVPGLREELLAIALSGGASIPRAQQLVDDADIAELQSPEPSARVLALSRVAGVPASDLLRATAQAALQQARTQARFRAAKLGTALLIPLGACTLPAFLLLGVAPLLLSVLTTANPL